MQTNKSILLVDDESDLVETIALTLSDAIQGANILRAGNGAEALRLIEQERPAVVVSDINMPEMDGLTMLLHLGERKIFTPVVLMTGYSDLEKLRKAWQLGAYDYIEKPFTSEKLVMTVRLAITMGEDYNRHRAELRLAKPSLSAAFIRVDHEVAPKIRRHCESLGVSVEDFVNDLMRKIV